MNREILYKEITIHCDVHAVFQLGVTSLAYVIWFPVASRVKLQLQVLAKVFLELYISKRRMLTAWKQKSNIH